MRIFGWLLGFVLLGACDATTENVEDQKTQQLLDQKISYDHTHHTNIRERDALEDKCPASGTRHWHAWLDQISQAKKTPRISARLNITGQIDMPTPGYRMSWDFAALDPLFPAIQKIDLHFHPPAGMLIQAVTPTNYTLQIPVNQHSYQEIRVQCGKRVLTNLLNIGPSD